jgi:hypothetical protein
MNSDQTHVIVGASLAGAKAAETRREEGFDGRVVLLGTEEERPLRFWTRPASVWGTSCSRTRMPTRWTTSWDRPGSTRC